MTDDAVLQKRIRELDLDFAELRTQFYKLMRTVDELQTEVSAPGPMSEAKAVRRLDDFEIRLGEMHTEMRPLSGNVTKYLRRRIAEDNSARRLVEGMRGELKNLIERVDQLERAFPHSASDDLAKFFGKVTHQSEERSLGLDRRKGKRSK